MINRSWKYSRIAMRNWGKSGKYSASLLFVILLVQFLIATSNCDPVGSSMEPMEPRMALEQQPELRNIIQVPSRCPPGTAFFKGRCRRVFH